MRRRAFVFLALAAVPPSYGWAAGSAPVDVVTAIYKIYAGPKGDYQAGSLDDKRVVAYFSASLRQAVADMFAREDKTHEAILDFDPVTDSQDPQVQRLSIAAQGPNEVDATFYSGKLKHVVQYAMKSEGGAWKIDDITGGEGADRWDLRKIIAPDAK